MTTIHILAACIQGEMEVGKYPTHKKAETRLRAILKEAEVEGSNFEERCDNAADEDIFWVIEQFTV